MTCFLFAGHVTIVTWRSHIQAELVFLLEPDEICKCAELQISIIDEARLRTLNHVKIKVETFIAASTGNGS